MELSLDSPQEKRKRDVAAKPTASASAAAPASSLAAAAGPTKPQPAALEEVISCPVVLLSKMSLLNDDHQKILQVFKLQIMYFCSELFSQYFYYIFKTELL